MSAVAQKRLAIAGALAALAVFVVANAHLVSVAFQSQPACVAADGAALPAQRAC
jgi:hypothetical protein